MRTYVATSIEQAKATLNVRQTEADAAKLRIEELQAKREALQSCLLYTSPSPRD